MQINEEHGHIARFLDDVAAAIAVMDRKQIRGLPVTDSYKAMPGMLSLGDTSPEAGKTVSAEVLQR